MLGRHVVDRASDCIVVKGTRHHSLVSSGTIYIDSDGNLNREDLAGIDVIINCAGAVKGTDSLLQQANLTNVVNLSTIAKSAGVKAFVQVSSFSIYGKASLIGLETEPSPQSSYGRSKYEAEKFLAHLNDPEFRTISVRLPFMFSGSSGGLLKALIKAFRLLPAFPLPQAEVQRSMITYADAADALLAAATTGSGAVTAADPTPFSFSMLAQLMQTANERPPALVVLPEFLKKLAFLVAPSISNRLFKSNLLTCEANCLTGCTMQVGIEAEILGMLKK